VGRATCPSAQARGLWCVKGERKAKLRKELRVGMDSLEKGGIAKVYSIDFPQASGPARPVATVMVGSISNKEQYARKLHSDSVF